MFLRGTYIAQNFEHKFGMGSSLKTSFQNLFPTSKNLAGEKPLVLLPTLQFCYGLEEFCE